MCKLNGVFFPSCNHGIRVFWRCSTYTGPDPAPGTIPECPLFQDRRKQANFPCMTCMRRSGADICRQASQERLASPAPECQDPAVEAETQEETMERARLARVSSEERMRREGTTLEEEHRSSRDDKEALRRARRRRAADERVNAAGLMRRRGTAIRRGARHPWVPRGIVIRNENYLVREYEREHEQEHGDEAEAEHVREDEQEDEREDEREDEWEAFFS